MCIRVLEVPLLHAAAAAFGKQSAVLDDAQDAALQVVVLQVARPLFFTWSYDGSTLYTVREYGSPCPSAGLNGVTTLT